MASTKAPVDNPTCVAKKAGGYCARSSGAVHSASSDEGVLMIVVYTKA